MFGCPRWSVTMRPVFPAVCLIAMSVMLGSEPASAQTPDPVQQLRDEIAGLRADLQVIQLQYGERLDALEVQLAAQAGGGLDAPVAGTGGATAQVPAGAAGAGGPSGALPVYAPTAGSKIFNPDVAVIGNFLGTGGSNTVDPAPAFELREAEASLQAIVDPYARADVFLAFGEEGVELEEGFITFPTVPGGLLVKVGRQRTAFGKVNTLHTHVVPWADRPLVTNNLLGGNEGVADSGVSVARLIPNPWVFLEATGQVYRGESGEVFAASSRGDLSYTGRLRGYLDFTDNTNIDLGFSYARGHNASGVVDGIDVGRFTTQLFGADATVRWRPLRRSIYRSFVGRSEVVWSRREQFGGEQRAFGFYVSGDYRFARRWFAGARYDDSDRADAASLTDTGQSLLLTFWPSEFAQLRGQYRRTRYADRTTANEFLFQLLFSIGAHGAHPF